MHFHDLRHVGGTLAAATGASLKELMARLGHSSTRAALVYQHASRDRDQAIARALGGLVQQVRTATGDHVNEGLPRCVMRASCGPCVARTGRPPLAVVPSGI
jgi:hypothetical protein